MFNNTTTNGTSSEGSWLESNATTMQTSVYYYDSPYVDWISFETFLLVQKTCRVYIVPLICIFGAVSNTLSMIVIKKDGFDKSSNVLIMFLAASDLTYCIFKTEIPFLVFVYADGQIGFGFSHKLNLFFMYWSRINFALIDLSVAFSLALPVLITGERLLAMFFPLKFRIWVTPKTALVWSLATLFVIFVRVIISLFGLENVYYEGRLYLQYTDFARTDFNVILQDITNFTTGIFFLTLVTIGTIILGIKIYTIHKKRSKLANSGEGSVSKNTIRTTKMLMGVSVVYIIVCGGTYAVDEIRDNSLFGRMLFELNEVFYIINGSWNFFIYVYFNKKYKQILARMCCAKNNKAESKE